jgi:hypothetical protein
MSAYFRRLGTDGDAQLFASTDHTRSNWTPEIQHGSPPLALLTKAIEEILSDGMRIGRLTLDILGAIPVSEVRVQARVDRPGSRIALLSAEMSAERPDGPPRAVARVSAWALATSDTADAATNRYPPLVEGPTAPLELHWRTPGAISIRCSGGRNTTSLQGPRCIGSPPARTWSTTSRRPPCSAWQWWSIPPMALAQPSIRRSSST